MALDFGMALTTTTGMNMDEASLERKGKSLQVYTCRWRKETSLKGFRRRIHQ